MMGLFVIGFFLFMSYIGMTGVSLAASGTAGMVFVFAVVCLESFALIQWFMNAKDLAD